MHSKDAQEFFGNFVEQMDEHFLKLKRTKAFAKVFGGVIAAQKICKPCPHSYTREETFLTLQVTVRHNSNLYEALDAYVKGDLLKDENAYHCEKCNKKVEAVMRTCIQVGGILKKNYSTSRLIIMCGLGQSGLSLQITYFAQQTLPPCLVFHLKRFDFDWDNNRAIKFNDEFKFDRIIDMLPLVNHQQILVGYFLLSHFLIPTLSHLLLQLHCGWSRCCRRCPAC
jgi:ubiquitin carboxyl-terminal hydrolase 9/24